MTTVRSTPKLELDPAVIRRARALARRAGAPVVKIARTHTTVSVERAVLRLAGLAGADHEGEPWVNHLVDAVRDEVGLEDGVTTPVYDALRRGEAPDLFTLAQMSAAGSVSFRLPKGRDSLAAQKLALRRSILVMLVSCSAASVITWPPRANAFPSAAEPSSWEKSAPRPRFLTTM